MVSGDSMLENSALSLKINRYAREKYIFDGTLDGSFV